MKVNPLVTIYIPSKDYGKYCEKAILSVINQVYENWELILIDEGSKDSTNSIFNYFKVKYPDKISIIRNDNPIGLQKIANLVLGIAKGKYIMRLDADDWLHNFAVKILVYELEKNPKIGIAYPNYYYTDKKGIVIGVESRQFNSKIDLATKLPPHGACTLIETKALKVAGGYSEDIDAQDGWELWMKLHNRIGAIGIDLPLFYYRQHNSSLSKDNTRLLRARERIIKKIGNQLKGDYKPRVLGVIPVKESYPNFNNIPFKKINGESLLEIAIKSSLDSNYVSDVIVSTNSKNVIKFSQELEESNKVPTHYRYKRISKADSKNIPIIDILKSAAETYNIQNNYYPDILIFLSLHSINRKATHIDKAINMLKLSKTDSVVSVQEERDPIFRYSENGLNIINPGRFKDLVYDNERLYRFNGSIIAIWWEVLKEDLLFGEKTSFIEMSNKESFQVKDDSFFEE